jgi:hypothetical protein
MRMRMEVSTTKIIEVWSQKSHKDSSLIPRLVPSQGVSSGPKMTACHSMIFVSMGAPVTPEGGSVWSLNSHSREQQLKKKRVVCVRRR